ncbi:MAG: hypothetical protein ACLVJH_12030 [Faecalibacterium prausnitzii]
MEKIKISAKGCGTRGVGLGERSFGTERPDPDHLRQLYCHVIALGTLLLTLPIASRHGRLDVLNAVFYSHQRHLRHRSGGAGSWTQFTWFERAVVLLSVGGLGRITCSFLRWRMRRRMSFGICGLLGESAFSGHAIGPKVC